MRLRADKLDKMSCSSQGERWLRSKCCYRVILREVKFLSLSYISYALLQILLVLAVVTNSVWFQPPSCRCSWTKSHFRHVIDLSLPVWGCLWLHSLGSCGHLLGYSHVITQKYPEKFRPCRDTLSNENRNGSPKKCFSLSPLRWIVLRYLP